MPEQSRFERSIETQHLLKRLLEMSDGDIVEYSELSQLIGQNVHGGYSKLSTARRLAFEEVHRVFDCVPGIGVKRLGPDESADTARSSCERIRKQARRKLQMSASMPYDDMSEESRQRLTVSRTILAFTAEAGSKKNVKRIEEAVAKSNAELPFGKALALFQE